MSTIDQAKQDIDTGTKLPGLSTQLRTTSNQLFATFTDISVNESIKNGIGEIIDKINKKQSEIAKWENAYKSIERNIADANVKIATGTLDKKVHEAAQKSIETYRLKLLELDDKFQTTGASPSHLTPSGAVTDVSTTLGNLDSIKNDYQNFYNFANTCRLGEGSHKEDVYIGERDQNFEVRNEMFTNFVPGLTIAYSLKGYNGKDIELTDAVYDGEVRSSIVIKGVSFDPATGNITIQKGVEVLVDGEDVTDKNPTLPLKVTGGVSIGGQAMNHEKKVDLTLRQYANKSTKKSKYGFFGKKEKTGETVGNSRLARFKGRIREGITGLKEGVKKAPRKLYNLTCGTAHAVATTLLTMGHAPATLASAAVTTVGSAIEHGVSKNIEQSLSKNGGRGYAFRPSTYFMLLGGIISTPGKVIDDLKSTTYDPMAAQIRSEVDTVKAGNFSPLKSVKSSVSTWRNMFRVPQLLPDLKPG